MLDFEIKMENYRLERCDSHTRHTGGVAVYIQQCIDYKVILNTCYSNNIWCIVFQIKNCLLKGLYIVLYRSPSSSVPLFLNVFENLCQSYVDPSKMCVTMGDFNIDVSKISTYSKKLSDIITDSGQQQIVDYYTRVTSSSNTIIDLVITNTPSIKTNKSEDKISDHETIEVKLPVYKPNELSTKSYVSWKNYSKDLLIEILTRQNWLEFYLLTNVNDRLLYLCSV